VTAYEAAGVRCWVGGLTSFAARGSFDSERIAATDLGSSGALDIDGDVLVRGEADTDPAGGERALPATAARLLDTLEDHGTVAFIALSPDDAGEQWTATALAGDGEPWDLLVVWAFADGAGAEAGVGEVRDALADSSVGDLIEGDPADRLERDGTTLRLQAPLASETTSHWYRLQTTFDPIFSVGND
jgi:hypothetical protein